MVGTGSLLLLNKEASQKQTFTAALSDIMAYWNQRFTRIRSGLLLYGTSGAAVRGDTLYDLYTNSRQKTRRHFASQAVKKANGGPDASQMVYDPTDPAVVTFRTQFMNAGQINFWQTEYQTKLELANAAKEAIGFEFFMDVDGSIVFKPPFYNLDVLPNKPVSWIQDIDVIDWDFSESEAEVVTQIVMQGSMFGATDYGLGEDFTPYTSVTDYHLLRKYGWRQQTFNSEFMGDTQQMFYVGMDMLDRYNARRHRGTVNIPLRPELRLGFPVYIASKDQFWYVIGISHNIQFGGRAQTTLTLTAKRQKFIAPRGVGTLEITSVDTKTTKPLTSKDLSAKIVKQHGKAVLQSKASFKLTLGEAATLPPSISDQAAKQQSGFNPYEPLVLRHPKTGRIVGYPNMVLSYTRPFNPPPAQLKRNAGQKNKEDPKAFKGEQQKIKSLNTDPNKQVEGINEQFTHLKDDSVRDAQLTHRYSYGLNSAGVYVYCYDTSKSIQEVVFPPRSMITTDPDVGLKNQKGSAMMRPVSDERGFEVVGHFRYGRGVYLRDGSLILNEGEKNTPATVSTQVAVAGGLFETLEAQSQGLSTLTTTYPNPADAIAHLQPEELQTAGRINPETKKPEFSEQKLNLYDTAPLGSLQAKGLPTSVEASQLSRALTLAEMSVKEGTIPNEECSCLLGRADLAFINVGYQVKTLSGSSSQDVSGLPGSASSGGVTTSFGVLSPELVQKRKEVVQAYEDILSAQTKEEITKRVAAAEEKVSLLEADPLVQLDPEQSAAVARKRAFLEKVRKMLTGEISEEELSQITKEQAKIALEISTSAMWIANGTALDGIQELVGPEGFNGLLQQEELAAALTEGSPVSTLFPSKESLQLRVESFLVSLYSALDDPHQELEKALRGELTGASLLNPDDVRFGLGSPGQPQFGNFKPPFNAPNRALGGDPEALALSAKSSLGNIQKTWSDFGDKLNSNTQKAKLEQEVKNGQAKLDRLQGQKAELENFLSGPNNQQPKFAGDPQQQLNDINKQIAQVEQDIAKKQNKASQL
jgi:hypothetical protein